MLENVAPDLAGWRAASVPGLAWGHVFDTEFGLSGCLDGF
jgi:hypothetical protein